jgi:hypothetical protein
MSIKAVQHNYYPGFEPIGLSMTNDTGGAILYTNTEEISVVSPSIFENPVNNKGENDPEGTIKEFGVGEHILSVPISEDNRVEYYEYVSHEGYELVGIASIAVGKYNSYGCCVALYKNTQPVNCVRNKDGYTSFGKPIEKEYTKK